MALRTLAAIGLIGLSVSACVVHNWTPPAGPHDVVTVASAKCDIFAQSGGEATAFGAAGSPKFVGLSMGAMALGSAIGTASRQARLYNDCMMANGWVPAAQQ